MRHRGTAAPMTSAPATSHLFTLRLWPEPRPDGAPRWRARVTHVLSGETHHFREWPRLIGFVEEACGLAAAGPPSDGAGAMPGSPGRGQDAEVA
jgi:hypothetical protein